MTSLSRRASGILLHPTSLAGPLGAGDLGPCAHAFVDFLERSKQSWWQMLPLGPLGIGDSPYASPSMHAGNPCLISPEALAEDGLLEKRDLDRARRSLTSAPSRRKKSAGRERADHAIARAWRASLLEVAHRSFQSAPPAERRAFAAYRRKNASWLPDYTLFCAIKETRGGASWVSWPAPLRDRDPAALSEVRERLADRVELHALAQFLFDRQFERLRARCREAGVGLFGDVPIFVAHDSADVWVHREYFYLAKDGQPTVVAGVPPDSFSDDGQRWGNPLYRWDVLAEQGYSFWIDRLRAAFDRFDAVRLDHFIGFQRYFEIPGRAKTARKGVWKPGPGEAFFDAVFAALGAVQLVAEDLGSVTPEVFALRDRYEMPGMSVLQFAFDPGEAGEVYRPHNVSQRAVVYTGTHDNDTTRGWFEHRPRHASKHTLSMWKAQRDLAMRYTASNGQAMHWDMLRLGWMSPARTAIAPIQDVLGLGADARMNIPGTARGNWSFRLTRGELSARAAKSLAELTVTYGRAVR